MHEDMLGQLEPGGEQHRGPEHRVELEDVLADDVVGGGPEAVGEILAGAGVAERRVVVEQRVEPDVEDVIGVPRHGHAPLQPLAAERDVLQPRGDEGQRLVVARRRHDEIGALRVQALELLLEGRELEEPVLLLVELEHDLVDRAAVALEDLVLHLEVSAAGAVPPLVHPLVGEAVVVDTLEHLLDAALVLLVSGADEEVVGRVQARGQRLEALGVAVGQLLRGDALSVGGVGHRLAVLVGAGEKEHVLATLAVVAGQHVGGDRRVRVTEVRLRVDVVDRGGDVEAHGLT